MAKNIYYKNFRLDQNFETNTFLPIFNLKLFVPILFEPNMFSTFFVPQFFYQNVFEPKTFHNKHFIVVDDKQKRPQTKSIKLLFISYY